MTHSSAPPDGVRLKIKRAKSHLRDLKAMWRGFLKTRPYRVVPKDNPKTERREHTVIRAAPLPADLPLIAGDVIHNLRSALDQLIFLLANGGEAKHEKAAFPVWGTESKFKSGRPGNAKGVSKTALDILYALKPYKRGNDALWMLHYLDIVDKHRLLLTVAATHQQIVFDGVAAMQRAFPGKLDDAEGSLLLRLDSASPTPMAVGEVLLDAPIGDKSADDCKFPPFIALDEPEIGELKPLVPTLDQLVSFTEDTIALFAAQVRATPPLVRHERRPAKAASVVQSGSAWFGDR
jgi:hypothetical protein